MPGGDFPAVVHVHALAVDRRQPLPGQPQPRVDANALVGDRDGIGGLLIGDGEAVFSQGVDASGARGAELCGELGVGLYPIVNRPALRHPGRCADAGQRFALLGALQQFHDHVVFEVSGHCGD